MAVVCTGFTVSSDYIGFFLVDMSVVKAGYGLLCMRRHSVVEPSFGLNPDWFDRRYSPERLTHTPS